MTTHLLTLYFEEFKGTLRGRFAWLGAGVILLAVGGLATVATQDTWLDGYGIIAYGLVPLMFIPLTAGAIASPRADRFVESVFTAPVSRGTWLAAKILGAATLALAYYVALVPMLLVYAHHVGVPHLLGRLLLWTPGLLLVSVAVGTLVGVLFIGRSVAAPIATGMGVLLVYAGLVPLQELLVAQGNGATRTGHLVLLSPAVLLKNALGFTLVAPMVPATTTLTWIALAVVGFGSLALGCWVFLSAQGVETWEATSAQRGFVAVAIAVMVLVPVLSADTNYDVAPPRPNSAPPVRGLFARAGGNLALTQPGARAPERCCSTILNREEWPPLGTDMPSRRDLLILLPVDAAERITNLRITVTGENGLEAVADAAALAHADEHLETRDYPTDLGPAAVDGHHVTTGWMARIPVTLNPTHPWDIGGDRYPLAVVATYVVAGDARPRTLSARGAIDAQVASGIYEMGAASAVLPLMCFVAALRRWWSTR